MCKSLYISLLALCFVTPTIVFAQSNTLQNTIQSTQQVGNTQQNNATNSEDEEEERHKPKITVMKDQGLSLGVDVSPLIMRIFQKENTGIAFVGRYGFNYKWWANAEVGYQNTQYSNDNFSYKSNGTFLKIGIDYDLFQSEDFPVNDNIFVGARYGYAWQMHEANNFKIVDDYWGEYSGSVSNSAVNSHIFEILFGIRCEMLRNFYMGWTFRGRFLVASAHNNDLEPYAVPGFGNCGDTKAGIAFTYTIEYQIPFNKLGKKRNGQ